MKEQKLNSQIAVVKNRKSLVEFLDNLNFVKNAAWPEASKGSSIRMAISDYSKLKESGKTIYHYFNLTTGDISEIADRLAKIPLYSAAFSKKAIAEMEMLKKTFAANPCVEPEELAEIDRAIDRLNKEIENKTKQITLFSAKKIMPYEKCKNPENDKEYQTNGCNIVYNPAMRNPIIIEIGQGWATLIRKDDGTINFSNEHDYDVLKKYLSLSDFKKIMKKVQIFINSIMQCGIKSYYEKSQSDYDIFERESQGVHGDINDATYNSNGTFTDFDDIE